MHPVCLFTDLTMTSFIIKCLTLNKLVWYSFNKAVSRNAVQTPSLVILLQLIISGSGSLGLTTLSILAAINGQVIWGIVHPCLHSWLLPFTLGRTVVSQHRQHLKNTHITTTLSILTSLLFRAWIVYVDAPHLDSITMSSPLTNANKPSVA